jgi:hypothetical protein
MSEGIERAVAICRHLLPLIRAHGVIAEVSGVRVTRWVSVPFSAVLRTPFSKWPSCDARGRPLLPYGLNIRQGHKVLSMSWNDQGEVGVTSFKRGPWEDEVLRLGAAA